MNETPKKDDNISIVSGLPLRQAKSRDDGFYDSRSIRSFDSVANEEGATGRKPLVNYFEALMHLIKGYIGTGIYAMGDAFSNTGMGFGPILLWFFGCLNLYCQHLLVRCAEKIAESTPEDVRPSFSETVRYSFEEGSIFWNKYAQKAGTTAHILVYCTELGFCCVYYVFIADHLNQIYAWTAGHEMNIHLVMFLMIVPMWAMAFVGTLKTLVIFSIAANVLIWICSLIIFYYTCTDIPPLSDRPFITKDVIKIPLALGTLLFAFEGVTLILPLRAEVRDVDKFSSFCGILNMGFFIVGILFLAVGFVSYWKYGQEVKASVFLNFPENEGLATCAKIMVTIAVLCTYVLHQYVAFEVSYPRFYAKYGPFAYPKIVMGLYKSIPVVVTFFAANLIPFLDLFISLVGNIFGAILAIILPPTLQLIVFPERRWWSKLVDYFIIILGIVMMVFGVIFSIYFIVEAIKREGI